MAVCLFAVLQLPQKLQSFFKKLLIDGALQVFVVYGSPYILQQFIPLASTRNPWIIELWTNTNISGHSFMLIFKYISNRP